MGFKITEVILAVAIDPEDGDEGIPAVMMNGLSMPLVMADMERFKSLWPKVKKDLVRKGIDYKLIRLSGREDVTEELDIDLLP